MAQRDRHGQLGALVAEVADYPAGERQIGRAVDGGGTFLLEVAQNVAVAKREGDGAGQGARSVAEDGEAAARIGGVEEKRVVAAAPDGVEHPLAVDAAGHCAV